MALETDYGDSWDDEVELFIPKKKKDVDVNKTVLLQLEGQDGNAFSLMGAFQHQAKKEGWTPEEIEAVLTEAKRGDYEHLLTTISEHCRDTDDF